MPARPLWPASDPANECAAQVRRGRAQLPAGELGAMQVHGIGRTPRGRRSRASCADAPSKQGAGRSGSS
eukprot:8866152-Pyramimonas_sp.AAC.1